MNPLTSNHWRTSDLAVEPAPAERGLHMGPDGGAVACTLHPTPVAVGSGPGPGPAPCPLPPSAEAVRLAVPSPPLACRLHVVGPSLGF